jgi:plasmid stability protein
MYIDDNLNESLRQAAALEGRSAAAILRDALRAYLQERERPLPSDPFSDLIGAFASGRDDTALHHDRYLYGEDLDAEHRR